MNTARIRVVVYQDDQQIAETEVGYFYGQTYKVQIVTPDGVDAQTRQLEVDAFSSLTGPRK